jgi:hypothetical protein
MADTQPAPQEGSVEEAHEVLLSLLEPEKEKPESEEAAPTEEEESTEETQDESLEEEPEEETEEESEEESEGSDDEAEEDLLYAVKVDGEEHEVTLDELMKGYSRQSDYTKKTQEISEQRKQFQSSAEKHEVEMAQIRNERQQYVQTLQNIIEGSTQSLDKFVDVDWETLKATNPIEYVTKREEYREMQEKIQAIQHEQVAVQSKQSEDMKQLHAQTLQREHQLMADALPEWGDPKKQHEIGSHIRDYARVQGFNDEEIGSLVDHRSLIVLRKAMLYDEMNSSDVKSKKLKNKPRVVRSGKGVSRKDDSKRKRTSKMNRLQKSGHVDDAASILEDLMNS